MNQIPIPELVSTYLKNFGEEEPVHAKNLRRAMKRWKKQRPDVDILEWWKTQDPQSIVALRAFLFWLATKKLTDFSILEKVDAETNPIVSRETSMPVEMVRLGSRPLLEGGFKESGLAIFNHRFTGSAQDLSVTTKEYPIPSLQFDLDTVLDFLSFTMGRTRVGWIGFRPMSARKMTMTERALVSIGMGSEIETLPEIDAAQIEEVLARMATFPDASIRGGFFDLLRVRHRAIRENSYESNLINLWAFLEAHWVDEEAGVGLLTEDEYECVTSAIKSCIPDKKYSTVTNAISTLKGVTRNDQIIAGISGIGVVREDEVKSFVQKAFKTRSRFAHGGAIESKADLENTYKSISFILNIIDTLIIQNLERANVIVN